MNPIPRTSAVATISIYERELGMCLGSFEVVIRMWERGGDEKLAVMNDINLSKEKILVDLPRTEIGHLVEDSRGMFAVFWRHPLKPSIGSGRWMRITNINTGDHFRLSEFEFTITSVEFY
jgi:hypothetical protein